MSETTAKTRNTMNKILATPAALAAMPPKPKTAASSAMMKNTAAQYNMTKSSVAHGLSRTRAKRARAKIRYFAGNSAAF
jgi:hypothetical protein